MTREASERPAGATRWHTTLGGVALAALASGWAVVGGSDGLAAQQVGAAPGVEYRIEARLDEAAQQLEGRARVRYRNNSTDTIPDFFFHLYLNAFRPNSLWAQTDLANGITTFQDLGPDEHGFERVHSIEVGGAPVRLRYPFAPDSTIVGFDLPRPLTPGASVEIEVRWDARPSSVPRRQGRQGRQWDFAQWYPRVVVYDDEGWRPHPLYRAGEFYGEFATYDVTVDVADDQVIGATGVPVEGDPGWERAAALGTGPISYDREWYGSLEGPPCVERGGERVCGVYPARRLGQAELLGLLAAGEAPAGRRRVRWHAEDVHHFAWSASPDYIYEQGRWDDVTIHVLYRPGDERTWGEGVAVRRTAAALEWLDEIFGDYPYPQVTNLHRIEGGGTEFPMLIMDGSASQGLILHEVGHIYAHGILANNEWYEGWLDEGLSSFQTAWFNEDRGLSADPFAGSIGAVIARDLDGTSEPVVLEAEKYSEFGRYNHAIYTKGSVIFWMLRELAGEADFRRILRTYYERHRFEHVDSDDFKAVAEEVLGRDLDAFFAGWLFTTGRVDYGIEDVTVTRTGSGYRTDLSVVREGDLRMDVPVQVRGAAGETGTITASGGGVRERVSVTTAFEPQSVVLDPQGRTLDWNPANDGWSRGWFSSPTREVTLDRAPLAALPRCFDTVPLKVLPLAWGNSVGGATAGVRLRQSVAGVRSTEFTLGLPALPFGRSDEWNEADDAPTDVGSVHVRHERRGLGADAGTRLLAEGLFGEGRMLARLERSVTAALGGGTSTWAASGTLAGVRAPEYAALSEWTAQTTVGAEVGGRWAFRAPGTGSGSSGVRLGVGSGFDTRDRQWLRLFAGADLRRDLAGGWQIEVDAFAGGVAGRDGRADDTAFGNGNAAPAERRFSLSSADPWAELTNPLVRSRGSLLDGEGWVSGGGTLRGVDPRLTFPWVATASVTGRSPARTVQGWTLRGLATIGLGAAGAPADGARGLTHGDLIWSFGPGLEVSQPGAPLSIRLDLPIFVSRPEAAASLRDDTAGLRVQVGFVRR